MKFTILLTCYNHAHLLPITWQSILAQTEPNFECVAVNDCAQDDTESVLLSLQTRSGLDFKIIRTPNNLGQAGAINYAIERIASDYIIILNDDDYLMHDALEASKFIINKTQAAIFGAGCVIFEGNWLNDYVGSRTIKEIDGNYSDIDVQIKKPSDIDVNWPGTVAMTHSSQTICRSAWQAVGGYRSRELRLPQIPWSDRDFQIRVARQFGCAQAPGAHFVFWRRDSSVDKNNS